MEPDSHVTWEVAMILRSLRNLAFVVVVLGLLAGVACATESPFEHTEWVLESYGIQGSQQAVIPGTKITATFDSTEGTVSGSTGCNHYSGSYEVDSDVLAISRIAMTEMACLEPEGIMEQEQRYVSALGTSGRYDYQDGELKIFYSPGEVLVFKQTTD